MKKCKNTTSYKTIVQTNNESAETNDKSKLKTTVLLLLLAFFAIATATLAWFTLNSFVSVDNMEMTIGTGTELKVAINDYGADLSRYSNEITNEMIDSVLNADNIRLADIKLDPLTSSDGRKLYTEAGSEKNANTGGFLEYDLYFIATSDMWVHLTSDNSSSSETDGTAVTTTSTTSAEVVQAVRISFDSSNGTSIFEPNKATAVANQSTFDLTNPMNYTNETRLVKLTALEPQKVTVRLWIEGEDPQCRDNIQNANLGVRLCFKGTDDNNESIG